MYATRPKRPLLLVALALLLTAGVGLRIWWVNTHIPPTLTPPALEVYQIGQWVPLEGSFQFSDDEHTENFHVQLVDIDFCTPQEFAQRYNLELSLFGEDEANLPEYVADLTLNFRNDSPDEASDLGHILFMFYKLFTPGSLKTFFPHPIVNAAMHPELGIKLEFKIPPASETGPVHFCLASYVEATGPVKGNLDQFPKQLQVSITPVRKVIEVPAPDALPS